MAEEKEGIMLNVTDQKFKELCDTNPVLVVDCYADWCGPCKVLVPVIEQLALEFKGKIRFGKLNTDENQETALSFNIMAIPTLLFFKNGKLVDRITGVVPKSEIEKRIYNCIK